MYTTSNQQLPCDVLYSRLSPNRSRQLVGYGGRDCAVHVFPFAGYTPVARLEGLTAPVTSMTFSPDQTTVAAGSDTGGLRLWDVATEQNTRTFLKGHTSTITEVEMHSSGHFVASVSTDTNLRIWDTRKSSCLQSYKDAKDPLCAVQFSPNGQWVATGCARGVVRIYNLRSSRLEAKLQLHTGAITSLSFHPEVYYLAVGSGDATISVWDLETFQCAFRSQSVNTPIDSVQFCGKRLLAASDHCLHVYDPQQPSDDTALPLEAPWTMIGDMAYVSFSDEAWFVECNGSTATTGRMRLSSALAASPSEESLPPAASPVEGAASGATAIQRQKPQGSPPRQQHPPMSNRAAPEVPPRAEKREVRKAPVPAQPTRTRLEPTLPRSQRLAMQENYVVEKPRVTNDTPYQHEGRQPFAVTTAFQAAAPEPPEVPFVEEDGDELDVVDQLISTSATVDKLMHRRLTHLRAIRAMWSQDQRGALEHLRQVCESGTEAGIVYDFLTAMQQQRMKEKMGMEALPDLLDVIQYSLNSSYDPLLLVALRTLRSMNTKFRARVDEGQRRSRLAQSNGHNDPLGVNSAGGCLERFAACSVQVMALTGRRDAIGDEARYLLSELPPPPG